MRGAAETLGRESFDKVVCNPPYFDFDDGTDGGKRASAKREGAANLADFIATGAACLRFGGDFTCWADAVNGQTVQLLQRLSGGSCQLWRAGRARWTGESRPG